MFMLSPMYVLYTVAAMVLLQTLTVSLMWIVSRSPETKTHANDNFSDVQ